MGRFSSSGYVKCRMISLSGNPKQNTTERIRTILFIAQCLAQIPSFLFI